MLTSVVPILLLPTSTHSTNKPRVSSSPTEEYPSYTQVRKTMIRWQMKTTCSSSSQTQFSPMPSRAPWLSTTLAVSPRTSMRRWRFPSLRKKSRVDSHALAATCHWQMWLRIKEWLFSIQLNAEKSIRYTTWNGMTMSATSPTRRHSYVLFSCKSMPNCSARTCSQESWNGHTLLPWVRACFATTIQFGVHCLQLILWMMPTITPTYP